MGNKQSAPIDYQPMPPQVMADISATREALLKELQAAGAEGVPRADAAPRPAYPYPEIDVSPPADGAVPNGLSCPVMTDEEFRAVAVDMGTVLADGGKELKEVMAAHGVVVITNCVNPAENRVLEKMWGADMVALTRDAELNAGTYHPYVRENHAALKEEGARAEAGAWIADRRGMLHGAAAWGVRMHPNVKRIYSILYDMPEAELCVGMDHVFYNPSKQEPMDEDAYWVHMDYSTNYPGFEDAKRECYQGIFYCWGSEGAEKATTVVWPGSHKALFDDLQQREERPCNHYFAHGLLRDRRVELKMRATREARRVPVPAGSLLLFSSKLSHQGWAGGERLAVPVCWEPKAYRDEGARWRKLWLACMGMPSTHWASLGIIHSHQSALELSISDAPHTDDTSMTNRAQAQLPMYPLLLPYTIAPARVGEWVKAAPTLWPRRNASVCADEFEKPEVVERLLREEILAVL